MEGREGNWSVFVDDDEEERGSRDENEPKEWKKGGE